MILSIVALQRGHTHLQKRWWRSGTEMQRCWGRSQLVNTNGFSCWKPHVVVSSLQAVSNDESTFKEPYPPSDSSTRADEATIVGGLFRIFLWVLLIPFKSITRKYIVVPSKQYYSIIHYTAFEFPFPPSSFADTRDWDKMYLFSPVCVRCGRPPFQNQRLNQFQLLILRELK